ncbi:MAG: 50S ribosomal protein L7/L12 [Proteobacteria bacterium]|nr:50S ribosomal protein L7/L12 [Pseudomonadota bacterium]
MTTNITKEDVIKFIENMTVLEISEMVKELEEKFGVSAAAATATMVSAGADSAEVATAEEKTEFDVILTAMGDKKIQVIKEVRAITGLGLKEAKELVDNVPSSVKEGIPEKDAEEIKNKLEGVGGSVEIK